MGIDHLMTPADTAARLGVSAWTVAKLRREGALTAVRVGNAWRFDPADITAYINRNRSEGTHDHNEEG